MIKFRPIHGVQRVSIDAPPPSIKGEEGSVVVIEDD